MRRAILALTVSAATVVLASPTTAGAGGTGSSWTVYHGAPDGAGVAAGVPAVDVSRFAWRSPALDGQLYGEPLVSGDRVFVATENDTVYALDGSTGAVLWSAHVGHPVRSTSLPCGNISPTVGITGTPVIDEARGEIFVVADELVGGQPVHELTGLDLASGRIELRQGVDPRGSTASALLQRTGLTVDSGRVVFGFGGNYGDCADYRGWVVSVPEGGGPAVTFGVDSGPNESRGAIWMGGAAPVVDATGNIWVTAGNGSVTSPRQRYDDSDSLLELSPALTLVQYFAPSSWASDNAQDLDLSSAPALLSDGQVLAAGKSRTVYVLDTHALGGIGGQQAQLRNACGDNIDGGIAMQGTIAYLPCLAGPIAVQATSAPAGARLLWHASVGGGPPVLAAGRVWTISPDGTVFGLDPATGHVVARADVGAEANHFSTPSFGAGLMLVPTSTRVVAFPAAGGTGGATTTTTAPTATSGTSATATTRARGVGAPASGWPGAAIAGVVIGALALAGGLAWLVSRRRRST